MKKDKAKIIQRKKRHRRIKKKVRGSKLRPRLVVNRSLKHIYAQVVDDDIGKTLVSFSSRAKEVREYSKEKDISTKTEKSRIVGLLIAKKCIDANIKGVVFDRAGYKYHGRIKSLADGAREGGLKF